MCISVVTRNRIGRGTRGHLPCPMRIRVGMQKRRFSRVTSPMMMGLTSGGPQRAEWCITNRLHLGEGYPVVSRNPKRIASRSQIRMLCGGSKRLQQLVVTPRKARITSLVCSRKEVRRLSADVSPQIRGMGCRSGIESAIPIGQRFVTPIKQRVPGRDVMRLVLRSSRPVEKPTELRVDNALDKPTGKRATKRVLTYLGTRIQI